jgi:hypothetical protein
LLLEVSAAVLGFEGRTDPILETRQEFPDRVRARSLVEL